jgi:molybdopterin-guanine dinucleotide biosynthesis protein A
MLSIEGKPILEYLLARFAWPGPTMLVTAPGREHPPGCEHFDREVVDPRPGEGPLRGVFTALKNLQTPLILVTTVDMPAIEPVHLNWLIAELQSRPTAHGIMLQRKTPEGIFLEPFPSIYRQQAVGAVAQRWERGKKSIQPLAGRDGILALDCPADWNQRMWTNLNRLEDLLAFLPGL